MFEVFRASTGSKLIHIQYKVKFEVICSIPKKPFGGTLTVKYVPSLVNGKARLIEWNSFQQWIESLRSSKYTAEEFTVFVLNTIVGRAKPFEVEVQTEVTSSFHLPVVITAREGGSELSSTLGSGGTVVNVHYHGDEAE